MNSGTRKLDQTLPVTTAEAPADELRALLAAIVDSSDDAIVSKTLEGVITSWNRGAEQLFGYPAAEAVGQSIFLIIPEDRKAEEEDVLARLRRGEKVDHFETVRRRKDGSEVHISLTVSPIRDATGTVIGASKIARDISDRERLNVLTRVVLAQEDERRRIARELHDQLGQHLTALRLTLEMIKASSVQQSELRDQVEMLEQLALQLDQEVAFRVCELRPTDLDSPGLEAALTKYVRTWSKHFGIQVHLHTVPAADEGLTLELKTTTYRLAQESLTNIAKHARARRVDIALDRNSTHLSLIIEDDGVGFDPAAVQAAGKGFGLVGMRERAALVGAHFEVESTAGRGTTVILRAPLAAGIRT